MPFLAALPLAAQQNCLPCHEAQVKAFATSGMGRSVVRLKLPDAKFERQRSKFSVQNRGADLFHRVERDGLTAEYPVALAIGSGRVGQSFAVRIGEALFQSPISWYAQSGRWDLSPGFQRDAAPDFDRRIMPECLACHAGRTNPISCEGCHALSGKHYANPVKLVMAERDAICERCHLQGEQRILHPGSRWTDPQPAITAYVSSARSETLRVVSQVEQLAMSKCARASNGKLWCGTCHDVHGPGKDVSQVCLGCHSDSLPAKHPPPTEACAPCHMPRRPTPEVAHTVYTDHRIRRSPADEKPVSEGARSLRAWREPEPAFRDRNLGLAYIYAGQRERSEEWVQRGFALLLPLARKDAEVYAAIGSVLLQKQRPVEAGKLFAESSRLEPGNAAYLHNQAVAALNAGNTAGAIAFLEQAVSADPLIEESWSLLARIYGQTNRPELRRQTLERYLKAVPQRLAVRSALRRQP